MNYDDIKRCNERSKTTTNKGVAGAVRPKYQPTPREQQALVRNIQRSEAEVPVPRLKVENDGRCTKVFLEHADEAMGFTLLRADPRSLDL